MIEKRSLLPGITLRCCRDTRFKQGCLSFQLVQPMTREHSAANALIPAVLLRGTNRHPDLRSVTEHLDTLYGASAGTLVRRVGDYQTSGVYCGFMDDRFALPGDKVFAPMVDFLEELLLDSPLEEGGFRRDFVEGEKKNLIATIESELNDKRVYAMGRLLKTMCREDSFGLPRLGSREDVAALEAKALYDHYRKILADSPIHIFYVGSADADTVSAALLPLARKLGSREELSLSQTPFRGGEPRDVVETLDVTQGKLCLGYVTPITNRDPEFPAMQLLNTVFGAGMTSKLFTNVREKLSLCYSIGSGCYSAKGIVTVSAGIDFDKEELTRQEIARQLEACQRGDISPQELKAAREALLSSLRSVHDTPGAIEGYYATAVLNGMNMSVGEYMAAVERVTLEQVVAAANTLKLNTTYFLKGAGEND